ncbi:MAG: DEAD/DEAH box helicase [Bacillota bacterium]|nr:DEAD/DEAH box helicase [Bacillota bacterium]
MLPDAVSDRLRGQFTEQNWQRGLAYVQNGLVRLLDFRATDAGYALRAEIQALRPYLTACRIGADGSLLPGWSCSCRQEAGMACRHLAAACIACLPQESGTWWIQVRLYLRAMPLLDEIALLLRVDHRPDPTLPWTSCDPLSATGRKSLGTLRQELAGTEAARSLSEVERLTMAWRAVALKRPGYLSFADHVGRVYILEEVLPALPPDWRLFFDPGRAGREIRRPGSFPLFESTGYDFLDFDAERYARQHRPEPVTFVTETELWDPLAFTELESSEQLEHTLKQAPAGSAAEEAEESPEEDEVADWAGPETALPAEALAKLEALVTAAAPVDGRYDSPEGRYTLRPYQERGVGWLLALAEYSLGGVLADEMGLGKTLQLLVALARRRAETGGGRPVLLLCPKSLIHNWLRESRRFVPELATLTVTGPPQLREQRWREAAEMDLVITSYPIFLRDELEISKHAWGLLVLDEGQIARNPRTKLFRALRRFPVPARLILSGTPLENRPQDLWAAFALVLPGWLGSHRAFSERFPTALDAGLAARLHQRIRPFMLRRRKADVLPELPPRLDETIHVELNQEQLQLYERVRERARQQLRQGPEAASLPRRRMLVIEALTRLRQICDHPALLRPGARASGKLSVCTALVAALVAEGKKVLIFSQFVRMLDLLAAVCAEHGRACARLDGRTRDRQRQIDSFQTDPGIPVFLISLRAGGVGLNLTAAEAVILYDPWWNPAVEEQAADRAHRFGQRNSVTCYRLICSDTIESKVEELQQEKRELFSRLIEGEGLDGSLSTEQLFALLD